MRNVSRRVKDVLNESFAGMEDFPGELERLHKNVRETDDTIEIYYEFGKNGTGISKELMAIGEDLYRYSKDWYLTLTDPHFDQTDDVYDFVVIGTRLKDDSYLKTRRRKSGINEGAWGYNPIDSDDYLDRTHDVTDNLRKQLMKGLKCNRNPKAFAMQTQYTYMGLVNGFLQAYDIWKEVIRSWGIDLYEAYEAAFVTLDADEDNTQGWSDFKSFKKALHKTFDEFKRLMKQKYDFVYEVAVEQKRKHDALKKSGQLGKVGKVDATNDKATNESLCFKPFNIPSYEGQDWIIPEWADECIGTTRDLVDGMHHARYYAHIFELDNGDKYYCPIGVKRSRRMTMPTDYCVYNGQIMEADRCELMDQFDAEMWEADHDYRIPEQIRDEVVGTIKDLEGVYRCLYYACYYEMENGDKYYSPIGVRHTRKCARWQNYRFHNGEAREI